MIRHCVFVLVIVALTSGCGSDRRSSTGFRLPPGGSAEEGKAAFVSFGCPTCHTVSGVDLPRPAGAVPLPVALGGTVLRQPTDGHLVTSIIYPSYELARDPVRDLRLNGQSRMPQFADRMTVRQMTDLIEFLQTHYVVKAVQPAIPY